jgi:hypothetical protein
MLYPCIPSWDIKARTKGSCHRLNVRCSLTSAPRIEDGRKRNVYPPVPQELRRAMTEYALSARVSHSLYQGSASESAMPKHCQYSRKVHCVGFLQVGLIWNSNRKGYDRLVVRPGPLMYRQPSVVDREWAPLRSVNRMALG